MMAETLREHVRAHGDVPVMLAAFTWAATAPDEALAELVELAASSEGSDGLTDSWTS